MTIILEFKDNEIISKKLMMEKLYNHHSEHKYPYILIDKDMLPPITNCISPSSAYELPENFGIWFWIKKQINRIIDRFKS